MLVTTTVRVSGRGAVLQPRTPGSMITASSPGSISAWMVAASACVAPTVTTTCIATPAAYPLPHVSPCLPRVQRRQSTYVFQRVDFVAELGGVRLRQLRNQRRVPRTAAVLSMGITATVRHERGHGGCDTHGNQPRRSRNLNGAGRVSTWFSLFSTAAMTASFTMRGVSQLGNPCPRFNAAHDAGEAGIQGAPARGLPHP